MLHPSVGSACVARGGEVLATHRCPSDVPPFRPQPLFLPLASMSWGAGTSDLDSALMRGRPASSAATVRASQVTLL